MTTQVEQIEWHRCYDDSWKGFIVPEAFAHPAKFARGLITRIYTHMLAEGMLKRGDSVVDPFGGIGTGGIIAASYGLSWYGCELESKFHALAQQNFAMHMHMWMQFGDQAPVLVCGDSRKLRDNLAGVLPQAVVASPPFTGGTDTQGRGEKLLVDASAKHRHKTRLIQGSAKEYGNTPGQLDGLPAGDVNAVISSPPFVDPRGAAGRNPQDLACNRQGYAAGITNEYGDTEGQLSGMAVGDVDAVVGSPPYSERHAYADEARNEARAEKLKANGMIGGTRGLHKPAGEHPGNLAQLPQGDVHSIVTSPPYEANGNNEGHTYTRNFQYTGEHNYTGNRCSVTRYDNPTSDGQLGAQTGETFWHAARDIVAECYAILKPGGWSAWVCKDFVRNKARVPFCDDWCKLLESQGFVVTTRVHAMLVKETREADLFGGDDHVQKTERKSFFRRLAEKKGSPRIDWEEVIFARKQCDAAEHGAFAQISD